jgi:hypothetical protein
MARNRRKRSAYTILVRKEERTKTLGSPRSRSDDVEMAEHGLSSCVFSWFVAWLVGWLVG